jgi:hypothetical protein
MATKMTIPGIGAALLLGLGCVKKSFTPAGELPPINASGTYYARETLYSSTCPGFAARKERFIVEVEQRHNARMLRLMVSGIPYDASINADGQFSTTALTVPRGQLTTTTGIGGRFTRTGFTSRVTIKTVEQIMAARPGEPTSRMCEYQLRWEAEKQ